MSNQCSQVRRNPANGHNGIGKHEGDDVHVSGQEEQSAASEAVQRIISMCEDIRCLNILHCIELDASFGNYELHYLGRTEVLSR